VPRRIYSEYLRDLFARTIQSKLVNVALNIFDDEALDVSIDENAVVISLRSDKKRVSDKVVLDFGNFLPPHPKSKNQVFINAEKYFQNPWNPEIFNVEHGVENKLRAGAVVKCIGSESNFSRIDSVLIKNLVAKSCIKNDALNLGIDALPDGRILDENGSVSNRIFTLGTALKGILWESTAIPEIRAQSNKMALSLLGGD